MLGLRALGVGPRLLSRTRNSLDEGTSFADQNDRNSTRPGLASPDEGQPSDRRLQGLLAHGHGTCLYVSQRESRGQHDPTTVDGHSIVVSCQ